MNLNPPSPDLIQALETRLQSEFPVRKVIKADPNVKKGLQTCQEWSRRQERDYRRIVRAGKSKVNI